MRSSCTTMPVPFQATFLLLPFSLSRTWCTIARNEWQTVPSNCALVNRIFDRCITASVVMLGRFLHSVLAYHAHIFEISALIMWHDIEYFHEVFITPGILADRTGPSYAWLSRCLARLRWWDTVEWTRVHQYLPLLSFHDGAPIAQDSSD